MVKRSEKFKIPGFLEKKTFGKSLKYLVSWRQKRSEKRKDLV